MTTNGKEENARLFIEKLQELTKFLQDKNHFLRMSTT